MFTLADRRRYSPAGRRKNASKALILVAKDFACLFSPSPPFPRHEIKERLLEYGREYTHNAHSIYALEMDTVARSKYRAIPQSLNGARTPKFHSTRSLATIIGCAHCNAIRKIASFLNTLAYMGLSARARGRPIVSLWLRCR